MTFDLNYNDYVTINCTINEIHQTFNFLVDTQADICVIKQSSISGNPFVDTTNIINIRGIARDSLRSYGTTNIDLHVNDDLITHEFHLVPEDFNIDSDGILGKDFLAAYKCRIDYANMTLSVHSTHCAKIKLSGGPNADTFTIPPRSEVIKHFQIEATKECVVDHITFAPGVYAARTIVNPKQAYIRVINTTERPQNISRKIDRVESLENFHCYRANAVNPNVDRTNRLLNIINKDVPKQYQGKLDKLVEEFSDVFSLPEDKMTVNNFYSQSLRTSDNSPTYIRNYRTPYTSRAEIQRQVNHLLDNGLIEPCASNFNSPLLPKKSQDGTQVACVLGL